MASQVRECTGMKGLRDAITVEMAGNSASLSSPLPGFSRTGCRIDMQHRTIYAQPARSGEDEGANHVLDIPFFPENTTIRIGDDITARSEDRTGLGRITSVCAHLNGHNAIPDDFPAGPDDTNHSRLYLLEGLYGGSEKIFWVPSSPSTCVTYRQLLERLRRKGSPQEWFLDIRIRLEYSGDDIVLRPLQPSLIFFTARYRDTFCTYKYEFKLENR